MGPQKATVSMAPDQTAWLRDNGSRRIRRGWMRWHQRCEGGKAAVRLDQALSGRAAALFLPRCNGIPRLSGRGHSVISPCFRTLNGPA
jgi:hypothetical protein